MGKCSNAFFSETTNMIKAKLYMNVHWMVLYSLKVFCSDMKFKMVATAVLSLTLDPMGKMFQNASYRLTLDPKGKCSNAFFSETTNMIKAKLYMNVHWIVLYNLKVFCSDMKFKMAATAGISLTLKSLGQLKPICPGMIIGMSFAKLLFFMPIGNPRWPPPQDID